MMMMILPILAFYARMKPAERKGECKIEIMSKTYANSDINGHDGEMLKMGAFLWFEIL